MFKKIALTLLAAVILLPPMLNYSGMCISQMRWLSDEEKILILLNRNNLRTGKLYQNIEGFLKKNPKCCAVGRATTEEHAMASEGFKPPFDFWGQEIWGFGGDNVWITFNESIAPPNNYTQRKNYTSFMRMTNCGETLNY